MKIEFGVKISKAQDYRILSIHEFWMLIYSIKKQNKYILRHGSFEFRKMDGLCHVSFI